jgi:hypothetical protein
VGVVVGREEFDAMISRNANCVTIPNFLRYFQEQQTVKITL